MIIAVDFDGTIVEHAYPAIGKPVPYAFEVLKKLQQERHTLLLWTVREDDLLKEAVDYCSSKGLDFYAVNKNHPEEEAGDAPRKLMADIFIDDKNLGGLPDWGLIYRTIQAGGFDFHDIDYYNSDTDKKPKQEKNIFIQLGEAWDTARKYKK